MEKRNAGSGSGFGSRGSSIRKFDGKNYKLWAWQMELLLARERAWTIVNGSEECPPGPLKAEADEHGHGTAGGKAASSAYTDYTWRYYEALRLIFESLGESLQLQYMDIKDPGELWRRINSDYVGELQKSQLWIRRDLYEVKLKDYGSIEAYSMRIQNLIDEYRGGAETSTDKIFSEREHVFFLLNGIPQSEDWDVELRLINDQMRVLGEDPKAVIKKLRNREDAIKTSKGIAPEVALYTKKASKGKQKDQESGNQEKARTCFLCKKTGHVKRNCPNKKDRSDRDGTSKA
jgi:hypothetical protein